MKKVCSAFPDAARYQAAYIQGRSIIGAHTADSVVHMYLQPRRVPRLFVPGAPVFPQNPSGNPTFMAVAPEYRTVSAIRNWFVETGR
jgi:gluconate 2-dehydrogenase alpha chain